MLENMVLSWRTVWTGFRRYSLAGGVPWEVGFEVSQLALSASALSYCCSPRLPDCGRASGHDAHGLVSLKM